jgi:hypothetical protein
MSHHITFSVGVRKVGSVSFSSFTLRAQEKAYGIDFVDCLTYGPEEYIDMELWYRPDWDRAVARVSMLKAKVDVCEDEHRRKYDGARVEAMARLIAYCAEPSRRPYAHVRFS